jgi:hypothetical protein
MSLDFLSQVFPVLIALVGFPALLAAVINLAKVFGLPQGYAPTVSLYANALALLVVIYFVWSGKIDLLTEIDRELGTLATFLVMFSAFAGEIGLTKVFNTALRGVPYIGYSHTLEEEKQTEAVG